MSDMTEGWVVKKIGDVCDIQNGYAFKSKDYSDRGLRVIRIGNVQKGKIVDKKPSFLPLATQELYSGFILNESDILVSLTGDVGRVGRIEKHLLPAVLNQRVGRFEKIDTNLLLTSYLFKFLNSSEFESLVIQSAQGAAQKNSSTKKIKEIKIPIPPLETQKQIVAVLDKAFAAIDVAKANIEKNLQNAKELFQSKLNEIFTQKGDGWEEKKLSEISIEFGRGKSKHRPRNDTALYGGNYPFVQTGDVRNAHKKLTKYTQTYNEKGLAQSKLWSKGTICITIAANIAEVAILDFDACFPDSVIGLVVDPEKSDNDYAFYCLLFLQSELKMKGKGSAQDNINMGTFESQYFPIPSLKEQKQIVLKLDALLEKRKQAEALYQQKLEGLKELKKSILQKAFRGEIYYG